MRLDGGQKGLVSPYGRAHEPFRMLRLSIELSTGTQPGVRTLAFTSAEAGEGKSTIAANYAAATAHAGKQVLLIDADARRPTIHGFFGLSRGPGLLDSLLREADITFGRAVAAHDGLTILTAGAPSLTADVVSSPRMSRLIQSAATQFDTIVIDTPPVLFAAETLAVTAFEDVHTVVVATPTTKRRSLRRALHSLELAGADVAGIILNRDGKLATYGAY